MKLIVFSLFIFLLSVQAQSSLLSPRTYNKLNDIQESINALPNVDKSEAVSEINETLIELAEDLQGNSLGLALTYQTHAQLKVKQEQYLEAESLLSKAVALDELDTATQLQLKLFLSQILLAQEKFIEIIQLLEAAVANKEYKISAPVYALLAASHYYKNDFSKGLPHIIMAIDIAKKPREAWLQMAFSGFYHQKNYKKALFYTNALVLNYPDKKDYWRQKAGLHQLMENYNSAAISSELAFKKKLIEKENEYINLAQLLAGQGNPFKVASVLEKAFKNKNIPENKKTLNLLQQAWMQAKEIDKGREVLATIYSQYPDSKVGVRLLRLLVDNENWEAALKVAGTLYDSNITDKQKGNVLVLNGISQFRLGHPRKALVTFSKAAAIKTSSSQAKGWMSYIKQLQES